MTMREEDEPTKRAWYADDVIAIVVTLAIVLASIVGQWINEVSK